MMGMSPPGSAGGAAFWTSPFIRLGHRMITKLRPLFPILLLTAGHGAVDTYINLLPILAPGLAEHLNIPLGDIVMLIGVSSLLSNLIQPAVGWLMSRRNMSWALWFSVMLASCSVWMGFAPNFAMLALFIMLGALGTGVYHPEAVLAASDASGSKDYLGVPLFMAGAAAIYAVATPLSIRVSERFGFGAIGWFCVPGLLIGFLLFLSHRRKRREHPSVVLRPRSKRMTRVEEGGESFWPLLAVGFCFCVASGLFWAILSSHYELRFGVEARHWAGWTLMVLGVASSLMSFVWSSLSRKYSFYLLAFLSQLAAAPLFLLMAWAPSPTWGFAVAVPLSLVTPAALHPMAVTLSRRASGSTQAVRAGLMIGATYGASSIAVMAAGALLRRGTSSSWIVAFVALCSFVAVILSGWRLLMSKRSRAGGS